MFYREILEKDKELYNVFVSHPLQSWEWGEFREKTGVKVIRRGAFVGMKLIGGFQLTIHKLSLVPFTIGYLPKGSLPNGDLLKELEKIGRKERCIFIKLEPNVEKANYELGIRNYELKIGNYSLKKSPHPLFTHYTFQIDLAKTEEELLEKMHPKTRYNIRLAQKKGVIVEEDNSDKAFKEYLRLTFETTKRQGFYAHDENYHRLMWRVLGPKSLKRGQTLKGKGLIPAVQIAHLLTAKYQGKILVTWIVLLFNGILYYPYGASSSEHREVMASNLMMWEAMRWGKMRGAKIFDLWGSLGSSPNPKDSWYGFHRFKEGYNPRLVEFIGSYDLVFNPFLYRLYSMGNSFRWYILWLKRQLSI